MSADMEVQTSNEPIEYTIISWIPIPKPFLTVDGHEINLILMQQPTLEAIEEEVKRLMERDTKQFITNMAYQDALTNYLVECDKTDVLDSIRRMMELAESSGKHRYSVADMIFIPDLQSSWPEYATINRDIRKLCIEFNVQPLLVNKPLLKKQSGLDVLVIEARYWDEFVTGVSLGTNLNNFGLKKLANVLVKHTMIGLNNRDVLVSKQGQALLTPSPIGLTQEYLDSPVMRNHLISRGLFCRKSSRSLSRGRKPIKKSLKKNSAGGPGNKRQRRSTSDSGAGSSLSDDLQDLVFLNNRRSVTEAELETNDLLPSEQVTRINRVLKAYKDKNILLSEMTGKVRILEDKLAEKDAVIKQGDAHLKKTEDAYKKKEEKYNLTIAKLNKDLDSWKSAESRTEDLAARYKRWYEDEKAENEELLDEVYHLKDKIKKLKAKKTKRSKSSNN